MPFQYITSKEKMKGKIITGAALLVAIGSVDRDNMGAIDYILLITAVIWGIISIMDWRDRHAKG